MTGFIINLSFNVSEIPFLQNLDSLVMLPMGCGEQNLAKLAPNIFALKYMNALNYNNDQLKETALKNIRKGKQC